MMQQEMMAVLTGLVVLLVLCNSSMSQMHQRELQDAEQPTISIENMENSKYTSVFNGIDYY